MPSLDTVMLRADAAARALNLTGADRERFLALVAPGFPEWLNDEAKGGPVQLGTLIDRTEQSITPLELDIDALAVVLAILAPTEFIAARAGQPCDAPPGSESKLAIMAERASRGEPLFVRGDAHLADKLGFLARLSANDHVRGSLVHLPPQEAKGGPPRFDTEETHSPA